MKKNIVKKIIIALFIIVMSLTSFSNVLEEEYKKSFLFFWEQISTNPNTYGLVKDRYPGNTHIASIASTGFGLSAIPIGIQEKWISYEDGYKRAFKTLETLETLERFNGFYYHFINIHTGKRAWNCEISSIDTALLVAGVLTVGEYFGGEIKEKAKKIYDEINWRVFRDPISKQFYMAYYPEKGFEGKWDFYAEQLILYFLAAGSDTYYANSYDTFIRHYGEYNRIKLINSWFGSLFTYQYSHAWIDFRNLIDSNNVNWFENSKKAVLTNYQFCQDLSDEYKSFNENSWGLSACDSPHGYEGLYGAPPSGYSNDQHKVDGTIATSAAVASIVFNKELALKALNYYYTIEGLVGKYGLKNAFNLDKNWVANDYIGIDKGITLLMIANYKSEIIWKLFMKNENIKNAIKTLFFREVDNEYK